MIQTYFGNGKGKTTAAVGAAVRCAGCDGKVLFVQFLKNNDSGEFVFLKPDCGIDVIYSKECYNLYDNMNSERFTSLTAAYNTLLFDEVAEKSNSYDMIILDEMLDVIDFGYVNEDDFLQLLNILKQSSEIILTGHSVTEKIVGVSDYVSEVKEIKHPYNKGFLPRKGIEF